MKLKKYLGKVKNNFDNSPLRKTVKNNNSLPKATENIEKITKEIRERFEIEYSKIEKPLNLVLMGEVKSGKSTLINSLARGEVSPVNVTEATASIIEISYNQNKRAAINLQDDIIKGTPDDIFKILEEHHSDLDFFSRCKSVSIEMPFPTLKKMNIVDTPGLATVTLQNEELTQNYIQQSDVVLWIFNVHHLGQSDVAETLSRVSELGKPIIGIINRIDEVEHDTKELIDYVENQYMIFLDKCFTYSALNAFNGIKNNDEELLETSGYYELLDYLENNIEKKAASIHEKSIISSVDALIQQELECHNIFIDKCNKLTEQIKVHKEEVDYHNTRIKNKFKIKLESWSKNELLKGEELKLINKVENFNIISNKDKKAELKKELEHIFSNENLKKQLNTILEEINNDFKEDWKLSINKINEKMEKEFNKIEVREDQLMQQLMDDNFQSGTELAKQGAGKGAAIGGAIGTTMATYAAVLGPYASSVTIGMAAGAFLPPLLIGGALVGAVSKIFNFKNQKKNYKNIIRNQFKDIKRDYIEGKVIPKIIGNIDDQSNEVASTIQKKFVSTLTKGWSIESLSKIKEKTKLYNKELKHLHTENISQR